jgi:hypothetical protein
MHIICRSQRTGAWHILDYCARLTGNVRANAPRKQPRIEIVSSPCAISYNYLQFLALIEVGDRGSVLCARGWR